MNTSELRIGNLLQRDSETFNVGHIQDNFHGVLINGKGIIGVEPIPLTYSWMKKLGFDTMDYEVDVIEWGMSDDPYFSIEQSGVPPEDKPYMFTYDVGMGETEIEVKYVHELQNLYFVIKRKELIYG